MANCARSTIQGISILGNTISGLNLLNWCKVYNTLVIPILIYGAQVWYTGHNQKGLIHNLQVAQNKGICKIMGTFHTLPIEPLHNITRILPLSHVMTKLMHSYFIRLRVMPMHTKVQSVLTDN